MKHQTLEIIQTHTETLTALENTFNRLRSVAGFDSKANGHTSWPDVHVTDAAGRQIQTAALVTETLSDGSTVYTIRLFSAAIAATITNQPAQLAAPQKGATA